MTADIALDRLGWDAGWTEAELDSSEAGRIGTDVLGPGLRELAARHASVGEVRGLGVFWAVELVRDRATREPLVPFLHPSAGR